ncbi:NUDIX domain-containing protein [Candidatus Parcubacteria bacterium]|nr:NUDIX domain-containing protein [Candidatus Parcubacteria bacterium]
MSDKFKYIGSSYLILIKEENILLLKRANTGFMDGYYGLPAGHLDGNETAREGGVREVKEEIGININPLDLKVVHIMHRKAEKDERIDFFMTTEQYTGEIKNCEPEKCDELKWFPFNNLPENIIPYIQEVLNNYKQGKIYSEFGWK